MEGKKWRLITRSDFDGLVCAVLLKELDIISEILFVHPKDMQDGKIQVNEKDITTNLPYVDGVHLAFDHHFSESIRMASRPANHVIDVEAPSAARVVYNYFGGKLKFPNISDELMEAVDRADSAQFSQEEILYPKDWELLNFIMDPRTGLGRFKDFKISNYDLMIRLIDYVRVHNDIKEILSKDDVRERVEVYFAYDDKFKNQLREKSTQRDNTVIIDLRGVEIIYPGNRFMVYAMVPEAEISLHVFQEKDSGKTVIAAGKSIFNPASHANIGEIMLHYGGGGHKNAGTAQVDSRDADKVIEEIITAFQG